MTFSENFEGQIFAERYYRAGAHAPLFPARFKFHFSRLFANNQKMCQHFRVVLATQSHVHKRYEALAKLRVSIYRKSLRAFRCYAHSMLHEPYEFNKSFVCHL